MFLRLGNQAILLLLVQSIACGNQWPIFPLFNPLPLFPHSKLLPIFFENVTNHYKVAKSKRLFSIPILTHHIIAFK